MQPMVTLNPNRDQIENDEIENAEIKAGDSDIVNKLPRHYRWLRNYNKNYIIPFKSLLFSITIASGAIIFLLAILALSCKSFGFNNDYIEARCVELLAQNETLGFQRNVIEPKQQILNYRLPRSVVPAKYTLRIIPILKDNIFTFSGDVQILVTVNEETQNITLHAVDLGIKKSNVIVTALSGLDGHSPSQTMEITDQLFDTERDFYIIKLKENLLLNRTYEIYIKFNGTLNENMQGFYRSNYNYFNVTKWIAVTQFQPTDARRAFPCFDEPALKSKFIIKIAREAGMTSISNMEKLETTDGGSEYPGLYWDTFKESVPMSTYLVAFMVSDLKTIKEGRIFITTQETAVKDTEIANYFAERLLKFFEQFFQIKYPLNKLGLVGLPDFSAGAMENWGLITFRETAFLFDAKLSPIMNKQKIAIVIAHEISHQWFGNLVTPKWWSDLWLNEGFATYMEYLGVDGVSSEWKTLDLFLVNELHEVFVLDALSSSHKIHIEVVSPDEISEIFDRISYGKGASIIRMMDNFLTRPVFQNGLVKYLNDNSYSAVDQTVLWRYFTEAAYDANVLNLNLNVEQIMSTWILQNGFPLLTVTRNYTNKSIKISQEKFIYENGGYETRNQSLNYDNKNEPLWYVPITYTTQRHGKFSNTKPSHWLLAEKDIIIYNLAATEMEWIIVNVQQTGYYRVNYDINNWQMIIEQLYSNETYKNIPPTNRAQIIDDAFNLARSGHIDYTIPLNLTQYLSNEFEYVPWKAILNSFYFLDNLLITEEDYYLFQNYAIGTIDQIYSHMEETEIGANDIVNANMRLEISMFACDIGHTNCINRHKQDFYSWMNEDDPVNNPTDTNMQPVTYCTALKYGGYNEWKFLWNRFNNTSSQTEHEIIIRALGCTRELSLLKRLLAMAIDPTSGIRKQIVYLAFQAVSNNIIAHPLVFDFINENYRQIKKYLGGSLAGVVELIKNCVRITKQHDLNEFQRFASRHKLTDVRTIQQVIEDGKLNIAWIDNSYENVISWMENYQL